MYPTSPIPSMWLIIQEIRKAEESGSNTLVKKQVQLAKLIAPPRMYLPLSRVTYKGHNGKEGGYEEHSEREVRQEW